MRQAIIPGALLGAVLILASAPATAQSSTQSVDSLLRGPTRDHVPDPAPRTPAFKGKYRDFGGKAGMKAMVDLYMKYLMADPRTRHYFRWVDRRHVKKELADQFCVIMDGPCSYTGKDMIRAHKSFAIDRAAFNALVEDLQKAMTAKGVPFQTQNDLLSRLAPMYRQVVTKK